MKQRKLVGITVRDNNQRLGTTSCKGCKYIDGEDGCKHIDGEGGCKFSYTIDGYHTIYQTKCKGITKECIYYYIWQETI